MQIGQTGVVPYGKNKIGRVPEAEKSMPITGGYADIFQGALEIKVDAPGKIDHKRYCKPQGRSDQGYRHDD
jgi:hypothetical protein